MFERAKKLQAGTKILFAMKTRRIFLIPSPLVGEGRVRGILSYVRYRGQFMFTLPLYPSHQGRGI